MLVGGYAELKGLLTMGNIITTIDSQSNADIRLIISDRNWLETAALDQLKKTAELTGMRCAVGMPDLHPGKGQPIGAAFITQHHIYPHLVGSDIGCGMGLWLLDMPVRKVKIARWEKRLTGLDDPWEGDTETYLRRANIDPTAELIAEHLQCLGTIGGGNHFVELQAVEQIYDEAVLKAAGISHDQVVMLVHSGSRGVGQAVLRQHLERYGAAGFVSSAPEMIHYLAHHNQAVAWAVENRALIAERFCERLALDAQPILDITHNAVLPLSTTCVKALNNNDNDEGKDYWIHRKGASPTDSGLVMIPGSRGALSYLVKPKTEGVNHGLEQLALGGFSLAHGAGRKWKRSDTKGRLDRRFTPNDLTTTALGSRVICAQKALLYEEAPQAYKNIDVVIDDLVRANMIDLVAAFKPLLTYKTKRR